MLLQLLAVIAAYLLGAIPFGYVLGRLVKSVDIRSYGSGATGGTNVLRVLGWGPALATAVLDISKGTAATLIGVGLDRAMPAPFGLPGTGWMASLCALAAVAGHSWPVYLRFRGGKSVATGAGSLLAVIPMAIAYALPVFVLTVAATRFVSLASLLATLAAVLYVVLRATPVSYKVWIIGIGLIVFYRHNANIKRLLTGRENRFGKRVDPK